MRLEEIRLAQKEFATFTQEQVDKIFLVASTATNQQRIPLAKMAVEETGMGIVEDKVIKTILPQNISIMLIKILKLVVS